MKELGATIVLILGFLYERRNRARPYRVVDSSAAGVVAVSDEGPKEAT